MAAVNLLIYFLAISDLRVHNAFHISVLKKYVHYSTHVINQNDVQVEPEGDFLVELDYVLERRNILLWNRTIGQVKVQWKHLNPEEATWEFESHMRDTYPILFQGNSEDEE